MLSSGCGDGDQPDLFPGARVWESEHFRYHSYADDSSVCEAVLTRLERHFADIHAYLGMPWPAGAKVSYFKYRSEEELARSGKCPAFAEACSSGLNVYTTEPAHAHELIHAYFNANGHYPIPFLNEGLAEAMSCETAKGRMPPPWRDIVTEEPDPQRQVGLAGAWLIGHLLKHYPRERFLRWDARVQRGASPDKIATEFEAAYGVSLDAMWQEVSDLAGTQIQCIFLDECSAPAVRLDGTPTTVGIDCDGTNQFRTIQVDDATNLVIQQDLPSLLQLSTCDTVPTLTAFLSGAVSSQLATTLVRLEPGKYTFGAKKPSAPVEVKTHSAPELGLTNSCDDSAAFVFDASAFTQTNVAGLTIPAGAKGDTWFVRIAPGPGNYFVADTGSPAIALQQCLGCTGACEPTYSPRALPLDTAGAATLRVEQLTEGSTGATSVSILWRAKASP